MAGVQDSEAHFASRAAEYGVPSEFVGRLKAEGISTLAHLAFAIFRPGTEFEERAFTDWATDRNNGIPLTMGAAAALRRLHFESEVVMTATIRASVETPDPGIPKAIPFAEKAARLDVLRTRFNGLHIHGVGEPSHALLDEVCAQFESRVLKYIEPQRCTSRELEITTGRTDKKLKLDAGTLAIKESKSVLRADKEVFSVLAQGVTDIRPGADDVKPLDAALEAALKEYTVAFHLVPLPKFAVKDEVQAPVRKNYNAHSNDMPKAAERVFATALEVHYPMQLCDAIANTIALALSKKNVTAAFPCTVQLKIFGVYFSEEEFLNEAMKAQHPLAAELALPHELREAILFNFNAADHEVVKHRAAFLAKWVCRAKQLSSDECSLKDRMDPKAASAVHNKRILVFKEMLIDTGFPDLGVVDELITGASLTGEVPATGMLPGKFTPAVATDAEIREAALRIRPKLDTDNLGSGDPIIDAEVWRKTLEEVERGWLQGPLTRSSVPGDQPISRRFGLLQKKGKVRLIDDFSESGVNSTVGLCQAGRDFACIRVFDPKDKCMKYFRCCVLPFGATKLKLQPKDKFFINLFKELLQNNIPREVCALGNCNVIVFTDACYERDSLVWPCGLGGVLCEGDDKLYFSLEVPEYVRHALGELVKKQIIFEAETLSAVVAFILWKRRFVNKRCILFVDNEGSKFSLLRGSSDNSVVDKLAGFFAEHEASVHAVTWLARVPSKSNLADHPSRNDVSLPFFRIVLAGFSDCVSLAETKDEVGCSDIFLADWPAIRDVFSLCSAIVVQVCGFHEWQAMSDIMDIVKMKGLGLAWLDMLLWAGKGIEAVGFAKNQDCVTENITSMAQAGESRRESDQQGLDTHRERQFVPKRQSQDCAAITENMTSLAETKSKARVMVDCSTLDCVVDGMPALNQHCCQKQSCVKEYTKKTGGGQSNLFGCDTWWLWLVISICVVQGCWKWTNGGSVPWGRGWLTMASLVAVAEGFADTWYELSPTGGLSVNYHYAGASVWSTTDNRMYVFGGYTGSYLNALMAYDPQANAWETISPSSGTAPSARTYHTGVWDATNGRMWIFGGSDGSSYNDLHYYDVQANGWVEVSPSGTAITARTRHSAVWDSTNGRMWVFGGYGSSQNDLHYYDVTANQWVEVTPGGTAPTPRYAHRAEWDDAGGRLWIFAGNDATGPLLRVVQHAYSTYCKSVREMWFGKASFKKRGLVNDLFYYDLQARLSVAIL
ncbi:unnamed protein product [Cladocopium goreaui]|uniref:Rab9 effector protein with kelch motifs n=1 Tax=Cladocopium goreaui TaxID=2562237 RepID=A0A9P1FZA8_9DINO|nr:unnamed protein product [Cladocopium goreaui]